MSGPASPNHGSITHRCSCVPAGVCPGPVEGHGHWAFRIDVGRDPNGRRRQFYKSGFGSKDEARAAAKLALDVRKTQLGVTTPRSHAAALILWEDLQHLVLSGAADGYVYVVRADPYLKIGHATDPNQRLASLRRKSTQDRLICPADLNRARCKLWLTLAGSILDEQALHRLARNYWVCGEWFLSDPTLVDALARIEGVVEATSLRTDREVALCAA